jgi:hypothetical protein
MDMLLEGKWMAIPVQEQRHYDLAYRRADQHGDAIVGRSPGEVSDLLRSMR